MPSYPKAGFARTIREMAGEIADISLQNTAKAAGRPRKRPFKKGQSGNPKGKPRGTTNRGTRAAAMLLDGETETLARKAVEMAVSGDPAALRMCPDRIVAPRREQPVSVDLPAIHSAADISGAMAALVVRRRAAGSPPAKRSTCRRRSRFNLRAIDATDFERRLRQLEEARAAAPSNPLNTPNDRPSRTERCTRKLPFNFCRICSDM
jgi:Family of unknown function (DUF5681)